MGWGWCRGTGRRPWAGGTDPAVLPVLQHPLAGQVLSVPQKTGSAKDGLGAGCLCLPRCQLCPFLTLGLGSLLVRLRLTSHPAWGFTSGGVAEPAAQGPHLLPKAVCPVWVEALCHWSRWKPSMESKLRPGPLPTSWKSFPFPVHPVIRGREGWGPAVLPSLPFSSHSLLLLLFLAVLICIDSDFLARCP